METPINPNGQLMADAVGALTAAARLDSGADFAEFVALAVTAAVANVGGIGSALARRPGSWEAAHVHDMLTSSVGGDLAMLLEHRTEPLTVTVRPEQARHDLGYWQLFDDDQAELTCRCDALALPHTVLLADGSVTGDSTPWTDDQEAAAESVNHVVGQVEELRAQDLTAYSAALREAVHTAAAELFPALPVAVEVTVDPDWSYDAEQFDALAWSILKRAHDGALLPSSGIAPRDYPTGVDIATVERAAGRTPLERIATAGADDDDHTRDLRGPAAR